MRWLITTALSVFLLAATTVVARAEAPTDRGTVNVGPLASGSTASQGVAGYDPSGIQATASSNTEAPAAGPAGQPSGPSYTYRPIPYNAVVVPPPPQYNPTTGVITVGPGGAQSACPAGQTGFYSYDPNGAFAGVICVPDQGLPPANSPEIQLAEEASSKQPWPNLVLGINPGTGLTGLASWFWLGGGSPKMSDASATSGPLTVTVRATLVGVTWDFGDGARFDSTGLGQAYPRPSDIQHVFQSDTYRLPGGYTVAAFLRFKVSYSVNGGPWRDLGVKSKAYSRSYSVFQLQPEAVNTQ